MSMELNWKGTPFSPHHGGPKSLQLSADGYWYIAQQGWVNKQFGMYVLRQRGNERAELVNYSPFLQGQGQLQLFGNGELWLSSNPDDNNKATVGVKISGFVPFGSSAVPAQPVVASVDTEARAKADNALTLATRASDKANASESRLGALEGKINIHSSQIDNHQKTIDEYIPALIWQKVLDGLAYQKARWLSYEDPFLFNTIWDRGVRLLEFSGLVKKGTIKVNDPSIRDR